MKNIYQIILFLTISSLLLPSCLTLRPDSRSVSSPDYNGRVAVSGAHFKKKLSPIGISISIAAPLVGAGAGYMLAPIKYQNGEKTQDLMPANVALGAIVGYATNALINRSFGLNQQVECNDPNKWLRKVDRKYLVLNPSSSSFIAMPKSIEPNFQVKKWADVKDFKGAFPNSIYCNNVARNAMKNLGRSDLPNILKEFPNADCAAELKQSYINRAENTSQAINAGYLYSEYASQAEQKAADLVSSMQDAIDFGRAYAKSKYLESVLEKVNQYADVYSNRSTLPSLIEVFANVEGVNITKKALVNGSGTLEEYLKLGREYKDVVDVSDNAAIYYVKTVADAQLFKTQYPNSSYYQKFEGGYYVGNSTKGVTIMNNGDTYLDKSLSSAKQAHSQVLADRKRKEEERLAEEARKERELLAEAERQRKANEAREKLIREKGADYATNKSCRSQSGISWGRYERCDVTFADGTISYGKLIYVDGYYGFETGIFGDGKILYETYEDAAKDAYRMAKGLGRQNIGRYYPPRDNYSSSSSSSGNCNTDVYITIDIDWEIESKSKLVLAGGPSGVKIGECYGLGSTKDQVNVRHPSCVSGTYLFTYAWDIGESYEESISGSITIDGNHNKYNILVKGSSGKWKATVEGRN